MSDVWTDRLKVILQIVTVLAAIVASITSTWSANKTSAVHEQQIVNTQKLDETKKTADDTARKVDTVVKMGALK